MASTVGGPQGQVEQSLQPLFQLTGMMRRLEEKFIQQLDRIAFLRILRRTTTECRNGVCPA